MDTERLTFLFGDDVDLDQWDLDDPDDRAGLLEQTFADDLGPFVTVVATQVAEGDPPEVWATAQRLLARGLDRQRVLRQLTMALIPLMRDLLESGEPFDPESYVEALRRLPLPEVGELEEAMVEVARANPVVAADELVVAAVERLGRVQGDEVVMGLAERVLDHLLDPLGPLAMMADDLVVHVGDLTAGIVLTHRLTDDERGSGSLDASFDLAGFQRLDELRLPTGEPVEVHSPDAGYLEWVGPVGWLDGFAAGSTVAVEVDTDGVVHLSGLATEPEVDDALVARLRAVYDQAVDEPGLPVDAEELVLGLVVAESEAFAGPQAPLSELSAAAGLERRRDRVAHDVAVWRSDELVGRMARVAGAMGSEHPDTAKVLHALDLADLVAGVDPAELRDAVGPADAVALRAVLSDLGDEYVSSMVAEELFDRDGPDGRRRAEAFVGALIEAATRPRERAVARLLAAVCAERRGEPHVGEQHLQLAREADPDFEPVTDRLAWYASDRGDAATAVRLWRELEPSPATAQDLREIEPFTTSEQPRLGRNDRCWCGSGRKYKQCHLGVVDQPPLERRVGWLCRKAVGFLERRSSLVAADVLDIAYARADDAGDEDSVAATMADPVVLDLALTEGGWFERFLDERGALLPDDEAMLARTWVLVDRSVHEVVDVRPGEGLDLRNLRTGEVVAVTERAFSRQAAVGGLVCARPVPDGMGHQLVGAVFSVRPGLERELLDVLDGGDPEEIAAWIADQERPPELRNREGEELVECELVVDLGDEVAARAFLDATYEPDESIDGEGWVELFGINDEEILRARLSLDGSCLRVSTSSEERADRVLAVVLARFPEARVRSDERTPLDTAAMMRGGGAGASPLPPVASLAGDDDPDLAAAIEEIREGFESRWCDEPVPALGGLTPRQAAADPTRREQLVRLLASFEVPIQPDAVAMRPARLRELLGL